MDDLERRILEAEYREDLRQGIYFVITEMAARLRFQIRDPVSMRLVDDVEKRMKEEFT